MREFTGRIVAPGTVTAPALVSHGGLNTLASFQKALQFGDKKATCGDQNNPDLYGKEMLGKALCLPQTIGSTTGGLVLYCACAMERQPACMLFSKPIDSLAAAGSMPVTRVSHRIRRLPPPMPRPDRTPRTVPTSMAMGKLSNINTAPLPIRSGSPTGGGARSPGSGGPICLPGSHPMRCRSDRGQRFSSPGFRSGR